MSTPEQPVSPPLTRRQLREMRNTAATPIITPEMAEAPAAEDEQSVSDETAEAVVITDTTETPTAPPSDESEIELVEVASPAPVVDEDVAPEPQQIVDLDGPVLTRRQARERERLRTASVSVIPAVDRDAAGENAPSEAPAPGYAGGLLAGDGIEVELPSAFDPVLGRGSDATGSISTANALILSQTPETDALTSPVTATGEVLVTGSLLLPDSFGSTGTVPGTADGKDVDSVLLDGELPATSSPTPIAASAAISTIKSAEDVIKPPTPDKSNRLMLALVITAGALAIALTGAIIAALVSGAFR